MTRDVDPDHAADGAIAAAHERVDAAWRGDRRYLLDIAYRMLGSIQEAEDVVQEGYARLLRADVDEISDVRGWLVVVVSRLSLDHLRSAHARRETAAGPWLPEPVFGGPSSAQSVDPADRVTLDDSVRMALLIVLEELSPAERAAFVLHDVFQLPFESVGDIVGRSPAACRKLASRAREHVREHGQATRFTVEPTEHERVVRRFIDAASGGDLQALLEVLDPDVVGEADLGANNFMLAQPVAGAMNVAPRLLAIYGRPGIEFSCELVNGEPAAVARAERRVSAVVFLTARDGRVAEIHAVVDPEKLAHLQP
jgi:RNA polymerase sigma-70 factor (ECF subfamily)